MITDIIIQKASNGFIIFYDGKKLISQTVNSTMGICLDIMKGLHDQHFLETKDSECNTFGDDDGLPF